MKSLLVLLVALTVAASTVQADPVPIRFGEQRGFGVCSSTVPFSVEVQAGDRLAVFVTELVDIGDRCTIGCCCFDQRVRIFDANGNQVEDQFYVQRNDCGYLVKLTFLNTRLDVGGPTLIKVGDANQWGGGNLKLVVQRVNAPGLVTDSLRVGAEYLTSLTPGDVHTHILMTEENAVHYLTMRAAVNSAVRPRMALYSNGRLLDADEDNNGAICFSGVPSGRYVLLAYSAVNESGLYRIAMSAVGRCPVAVTPVTWSIVKNLYR